MTGYEYDSALSARVDLLRERYTYRDQKANTVLNVRRGDWNLIDPDAFSEAYPRPIVANMIEESGRHAAAALSPMPSFRCRVGSIGASQAAKDRADKRTHIVNHYMAESQVRAQMQIGADQFYTFGLIVAQIVPNFETKMPDILLRDSLGFYPVWNAKGETIEAAHVFTKRVVDLIAEYPELTIPLSRGRKTNTQSETYQVYHHDDGKNITLVVPGCGGGLILHRMKNPVGKCLFVCTKRPTIDGRLAGAFDDLVYVQLARNEMQMLTLDAVREAVQAPIAAPMDVTDIALGPDAIIRSQSPEQIRRIALDIPRESFAVIEHFASELRAGAISPEALGGSIDANVVTGKGVQELMAGYSQQVAMYQETLVGFFEKVAKLCFRMDEALWPDVEKTIEGVRDGAEYSLKYTPSKDVAGYHQVDVTYGTSTGLDPNRHVVWLLQLAAAGLYSKDTVLRALPGQVNAVQELAKIQVEQGRDGLMQAFVGMGQAVPAMATQGGDVSAVLGQMAEVVNRLEKGEPIEAILVKVFPPPPPPEPAAPGAASPEDPLAALLGGGGAAPGGAPAMPTDAAGRPDLNLMFAGMNASGSATNMGATVSRSTPAI